MLATLVLDLCGEVRLARGDKFQLLKTFLKEFCSIAGADRPNIDRALEIAAKGQRTRK
jgi:hypothetical protein